MIPAAVVDHTAPNLTAAQQYWYEQQKGAPNRAKVLVSRFFAPKIVNYASGEPFTPGWRKLVYLPVQPGSAAERVGKISGAYILFNYAATDRLIDPYSAKGGDGHAISQNNQVILVPNDLSPQVKGNYRDSAFFAVYSGYIAGDKNNSYRLLNTLEAGFDVPADQGNTGYALPDACAQCHGHDAEFGQAVDANGAISKDPYGGVFPFVKPNYLDTDQWYDAQRLDYSDLVGKLEPVFDGGTNRRSQQYRDAMNVIYQLNEQMKREGALAVRPAVEGIQVDKFQREAVTKWLDLHRSEENRIKVFAPIDRLFQTNGAPVDQRKGELHLTLDKLSQYCFRCHSSIKFNVFDTSYLKSSASKLGDYIPTMPLGRTLNKPEMACLKSLIYNLDEPAGVGSEKVVKDCNASFLMKGVSIAQSGYCYVLDDASFADGAKIKQGRCDANNYAEKIWKHEPATGHIHSASRPDKCLAVAPAYINRTTRQIKDTPFSGASASYAFQPVILKNCSDKHVDLRMRWTFDELGKMAMIRSRDDPKLCLSGSDDYSTSSLTDTYSEGCHLAQPNGSFFIRTFDYTKQSALAAIP